LIDAGSKRDVGKDVALPPDLAPAFLRRTVRRADVQVLALSGAVYLLKRK